MKTILTATIVYLISVSTFAQSEKDKQFIKKIYVSTNLTSYIRDKKEIISNPAMYSFNNKFFNVAAEFNFRPRFSLKIPIGIGLSNLDGTEKQNASFTNHFFYTGPDADAPENFFVNGPLLDFTSWHDKYFYYPKSVPDRGYVSRRPRDLIFQIGIFPKFILTNFEKMNISISLGLNFGQMDKYAISQYTSFQGQPGGSGDTIPNSYWEQTSTKLVYNSNPYFFVRSEFLIGFDFKITEKFGLNLETGFTNYATGHGVKSDKIFTSLNGADYKLIYEDYRNPDTYTQNDTKSTKPIKPVSLIFRFSLHYQIR